MKIAICINYVDYSDIVKKARQDVAISVLLKNKPKNILLYSFNFPEDNVELPSPFIVSKELSRDSQTDLGDDRRLPYIKDILDLGSQIFSCDIFGYMNSDILLSRDFYDVFNSNIDAYIFYKKDIEEISETDFYSNKIQVVNEKPYGVDAFFFRRKWWLSYRQLFPSNLIISNTEWDTCYNSIIQGITKNYCIERLLYHMIHEQIWNMDTRGGINNAIIWRTVRDKYGIPKFNPENKEAK